MRRSAPPRAHRSRLAAAERALPSSMWHATAGPSVAASTLTLHQVHACREARGVHAQGEPRVGMERARVHYGISRL